MSATAQKPESPEQTIARLEKSGDLDPNCAMCRDHFYPSFRAGKGFPFAPSHKASSMCLSGRRPHCSCDTCF